MNRCKGCVYWKWVKADKLYQTPGYHYCEKNKLTTCKRKAGEKEHYRITIDVIAEPDGVDRCSDIHHHLYMIDNQLMPWTVRAEEIKYKVELLSAEAEKDLALTWEDMRTIICIDEEMMDDPEAHPEWMEEQPFYEEMLKRFIEKKTLE